MPVERATTEGHARRFAPLMLVVLVGCFEADITRQPRDRAPLPAPSYAWAPDRGEVAEFPIPPGSRWLPDAQGRLVLEVASRSPSGATPLVAVYENASSPEQLEAYYRSTLGMEPARSPEGDLLFAESGLFPRVILKRTATATRIELVKVLPPGVAPPRLGVAATAGSPAAP